MISFLTAVRGYLLRFLSLFFLFVSAAVANGGPHPRGWSCSLWCLPPPYASYTPTTALFHSPTQPILSKAFVAEAPLFGEWFWTLSKRSIFGRCPPPMQAVCIRHCPTQPPVVCGLRIQATPTTKAIPLQSSSPS